MSVKKGASQLDWIISLGLFLLYVAWFFAFMAPSISFESNKNSLMVLLQNNFQEDFMWSTEKYPLFIEHNLTPAFKPLIIEAPAQPFFIENTEFVDWNDRLIILANLSARITPFWIYRIGTQTISIHGLNIEKDWASTENLSIHLDDSLPETLMYKDSTKIEDISYEINEVPFEPEEANYSDLGFAAIYNGATENINITTLVFADVQEVLSYIVCDGNYILRMEMNLDDYDSYYSNNLYFGNFQYSGDTQQINYTHDSVTLYSGDDVLTMFFDDEVDFTFTDYNDTLQMAIDLPVTGTYSYQFVFHDTNYSIQRYAYAYRYGAIEEMEGIRLDNITTDYYQLKERWNFPWDFYISVHINSSALSHLNPPVKEIGMKPTNARVYAETVDMNALTEQGEYLPINVNFRIW